MLAPIVSIKHIVQVEKTPIATGAVRNLQLIQGVVQTGVANFADVVEGSLVKAVYIEMWFKSNAAAGLDTKFQLIIEKVIGGQEPATFTQMNNLMTYPNKKNILYTSQGVVGDLSTQAIPIVRGWFKIPKGKQRFGLDDELFCNISSTGAEAENCGLAIYKEYK